MLTVFAWLWDDPLYRWNKHFRYGPEHVRVLRASVARHLRMPHEFLLITDRPDDDYGPGVRTMRLWDDFRGLPGWRSNGGGCWHRLKAFDRKVGRRIGARFVWLDLDCVITGPLDPLFDRPEPFVTLENANPPTLYCGSMMMMTPGARQEVWDDFAASPAGAMSLCQRKKLIGTDQAWITARLGPGEPTWGMRDGVYNFRHQMKDGPLPRDARIVFFTGPIDPSQPELQREHGWIGEHWRA